MYKGKIVFLILLGLLTACGASKGDASKAQAHYMLGMSYLTEGNVQPAFIEFQTAVKLNPGNKEFYNALGNIHRMLADPKKSEEAFKKAIRIDSKYPEAHNNLCYLYYTEKEYKKAVESCKKALSNTLYQTPEKAFYNLGMSYYRQGMYDDAVHSCIEATRRLPAFYIAYYGMALAYNAKGDYGQAAEAISKAIELDPRFRGDKAKAEAEFKAQKADAGEKKDLKDYLEILNY